MKDKIIAIFAILTLVIVVGWIGYCEIATNQVTFDVQLKKGEDPFRVFKTLLPSDSALVDVKQVNRDKDQYQVVVKTRQRRSQVLEWLRSSNRVENAQECQK